MKKGFTLIEVLLYVMMLGLIIYSLSQFYTLEMTAKIKNQTVQEVDQQGTAIMQIIGQTIRNATEINTPTQGNSGSSLSLNVSTGSLSPTVFSSSGGIVQITEGTGAAVPLNSDTLNVSNLNFQNVSAGDTPGIVRFSFTINYINNSGRNEYNYSKNFISSDSLR